MTYPVLPPVLPLIAQLSPGTPTGADTPPIAAEHEKIPATGQVQAIVPPQSVPQQPLSQPGSQSAELIASAAIARTSAEVTTLSQFKQRGTVHSVTGFMTPASSPAQPDPEPSTGTLPVTAQASLSSLLQPVIPPFKPELAPAPSDQNSDPNLAADSAIAPTSEPSSSVAIDSPAIAASQLRSKAVRQKSAPLLETLATPTPTTPSPATSKTIASTASTSTVPRTENMSPGQISPGQTSPRPTSLNKPPLQTQWQLTRKKSITASRTGSVAETATPKLVFMAEASPSVEPNKPAVPSAPVIELKADRQDYDADRQILTAEGNVVMRYQGAILDADRVQVSFLKRQAVAEGNTSLVRGTQKLIGDRMEYNYGNGSGRVFNARSEVYLKSLGSEPKTTLPNDVSRSGVSDELLSQRLLLRQPLANVTKTGQLSISTAFGGVNAGLREGQGNLPQSGAGGSVKHFRIEAERIDFDPLGWEATNARVTNDPFSPPELEIRAKKARIRSIGPYEDELYMGNGRLVFDQNTAVPLLFQRYVINRRNNNPIPTLLEFGYDAQERGGFFIQRTQTLLSNSKVQWTISPQFFIQAAASPKAFRQKLGIGSKTAANGILDPDLYGFRTDIQAVLTPKTLFKGFLSLSSLNDIESNLRARLLLRQELTQSRPNFTCINRPPRNVSTSAAPAASTSPDSGSTPATSLNSGTPATSSPQETPQKSPNCGIYEVSGNYTLNGEYTYRERLFNGSLGFQTVQQSFGALLTSPTYRINRTGINLSYQVGAQQVNAATDRADLLAAGSKDSRISLGRFQGSVALSHFLSLWQGQPLPATPNEGMKYTPVPVTPFVGIYSGVTGVGTYYTSGDTQNYLQGTLGILGQIGHFSRPYFDYTGFNLSLVQVVQTGQSPFFFDRIADQRYLSAGFTQQLYGPFRIGAQTALNLETGKQISTDYTFEYARRTYSVTLRYNPVQKIGSVNLIINDFNWSGGTNPFSNTEIRSVEGGIIRSND